MQAAPKDDCLTGNWIDFAKKYSESYETIFVKIGIMCLYSSGFQNQ